MIGLGVPLLVAIGAFMAGLALAMAAGFFVATRARDIIGVILPALY